GEDTDRRRGEHYVGYRDGNENGEVVGEDDAAGGHRQRRGKQNLKEKEKRNQPPGAAIRLTKEDIRAAGRRQLRGELGGDETVRNRQQSAEDPGEHSPPPTHRRQYEGNGDERPDADHIDHVQRDSAPEPDVS